MMPQRVIIMAKPFLGYPVKTGAIASVYGEGRGEILPLYVSSAKENIKYLKIQSSSSNKVNTINLTIRDIFKGLLSYFSTVLCRISGKSFKGFTLGRT